MNRDVVFTLESDPQNSTTTTLESDSEVTPISSPWMASPGADDQLDLGRIWEVYATAFLFFGIVGEVIPAGRAPSPDPLPVRHA